MKPLHQLNQTIDPETVKAMWALSGAFEPIRFRQTNGIWMMKLSRDAQWRRLDGTDFPGTGNIMHIWSQDAMMAQYRRTTSPTEEMVRPYIIETET